MLDPVQLVCYAQLTLGKGCTLPTGQMFSQLTWCLVPACPAEAYFESPTELLHRSFNRPRNAQLSEQVLTTGGSANQKVKR